MVNKGARESDGDNAEQRRYSKELRENPPVLIWVTVPNTGGIRVARLVKDPEGKSGPRPRPPCSCGLYGSPKRRTGPHHAETCGRNTPA